MDAQKQYLADNAKKEGVKSTPTGLQYRVLRDGQGARPRGTDTVEVHYRGRLIDGKEFDSSYKRGQTFEFALNRVIAGWTEGLQLMPVGSQYELTIPAELGYGARGAGGGAIPPHATLIFEVELIAIK